MSILMTPDIRTDKNKLMMTHSKIDETRMSLKSTYADAFKKRQNWDVANLTRIWRAQVENTRHTVQLIRLRSL